jgi:Spy/CpxP family protein refolding chaperone
MCFMSRAHRRCARVFRESHSDFEPGPWDRGDDWMRHHGRHHGSEEEGFGGFGVRRPLRVLAHKLDLDEKQITEMARILDELKTERAQAAVDDRRTLAEFADSLAGETFDAAKAAAAGDRRVASSGRLKEAIVRALSQIHTVLNPDQRTRLAYLIRTGVLLM